jgi:E3 ubiquitin-protein ligase HUWE1
VFQNNDCPVFLPISRDMQPNPQVDLQEWIQQLNKIDACISYYIQKYPALLLIGPVKRTKSTGAVKSPDQLVAKPAESLEQFASVPDFVAKNICILVRFLAGLLANASNKAVFNSVEELVDLLAAADDTVASVALETLSHLATPPCLHKQQAPEVHQHSTALHNSKTTSHKRLIALARGWGTRGSGLGLYTCATADDSEFGQGALPAQAGELNFAFFRSSTQEKKHLVSMEEEEEEDAVEDEMDESRLVRIQLLAKEIMSDGGGGMADALKTGDESDESSSLKRRKMAPMTLGDRKMRSTAELFLLCVEKAGGRNNIPEDRLFPLLADIRLTRAFHSRATRVGAVERRLQALITILHAHPSQEIMSGYFQAQPELCVELIDLLRPTVSSASVSSAAANPFGDASSLRQDGISALANSPNVPYDIRTLAIEALTALVARRDGTSGALTGVARHSSVLSELGVGKGQYLGLLPTLIRYSLSSLGSFLSTRENQPEPTVAPERSPEEAIAFEVGLAFVEATMPPPMSRIVQLERALEFIDAVLTLTSAVVSTPSGTSALTDCGLIPALLTTVAVDSHSLVSGLVPSSSSTVEVFRIKSLLRFITAQAIQILEGAIVTHNNALSAFHDLQGVEVLTTRLSKEILGSRKEKQSSPEKDSEVVPMECDTPESHSRAEMDVEMSDARGNRLQSSQRVLLFSIVTCLTVVFHQESTSSSVTTPSGAAQLRKPELTEALIEIMENVQAYGGHLASLIATLMSDVMNSDPHVVRHVHETGLAKSFIKMLTGGPDSDPTLPRVPELIMAVPNVLSALALTEDGANAVKEANPFPAMLRLFYHPKYAMPKSRCLLNEMTAIVGTGLDEIMRHVQSMRPLILDAIAEAMNKVAALGEELALKELRQEWTPPKMDLPASDLENERSCLMQYALNFGQLLEQILHNEDHCEPFVNAGGLDALLKLYPCLMPTGAQFLAHVSSLSCPSVSTLTHSTTEDSLTLVFKCIALRYDPFKLLQTMVNAVNAHLAKLEEHQTALRQACPNSIEPNADLIDASFVLDGLPREPLYAVSNFKFASTIKILSAYLRQVVGVQWITSLLAAVIKASCQRSQESGTGWSRTEREWKKELSSTTFEELLSRLSTFHQSAIFEVCRIRTEPGFEERDKERLAGLKTRQLRYRLRIVCPEGAVVRDGIEIDSCASVGSMEMGEIADAFDRCVNSSGVLRYRTRRGWVSEQTRGHGREPIAEVLNLWESNHEDAVVVAEKSAKDRVEASVPDLCSASANVLARVQTSYSELFSSLTRVVIQGVRSLPVRTVSFEQGTIGSHVATIMKMLSCEIRKGFSRREVVAAVNSIESLPPGAVNESGAAMYLGCLLSHLHSCLFEEKRERRMVNIPLLISLSNAHESIVSARCRSENGVVEEISLFDGVTFIFKQALADFESRALHDSPETRKDATGKMKPHQRLSRTTAASLPPATSLLRRLMSGPSITSSPVSSVLSRVKLTDLATLLGETKASKTIKDDGADAETFSPERFTRTLYCGVSETLMGAWTDQRFIHAPPYIVHPIATLVTEIIVGLEDATKKVKKALPRSPREEGGLWQPLRGIGMSQRTAQAAAAAAAEEEEFEPSEEAVSRLMEMGFSRDHALDAIESTSSNSLEVAMEYALSHPPPSPSTIERRGREREERRRRREEQAGGAAPNRSDEAVGSGGGASGVDAVADSTIRPASQQNAEGMESQAMDVDAPTETANDPANAEEKPCVDETITKAQSYLGAWKNDAPRISCDILAGTSEGSIATSTDGPIRVDSGLGVGDGEVEAVTVVLCSFLLDLCQRYPDERTGIVNMVLNRLKSQLTEQKIGDGQIECMVIPGRESSFAALCHATVLFTRALPKTRTLVLQQGLLHCLVSCTQQFLRSSTVAPGKWPLWLAPSLLLLDIMAQPVVAFGGDLAIGEEEDPENEVSIGKGELAQVKDEHKQQAAALSSLAHSLFSALQGGEGGFPGDGQDEKDSSTAMKNTQVPAQEGEEKTGADRGESLDSATASGEEHAFKSVPAYFPLIPTGSSDACVDICLNLLGRGSSAPPPGVVHACLLLLMRLLRTPKMSSHCLKSGAAESILSLPRECRFTGHSGLVTLILRRLLEDETTLQSAMEIEIRATVTKLHGKQASSSSNDKDRPSVPRRAFVQAITPLLCRDPVSFLKAVAVSVLFDKGGDNPSDAKVTLLSPVERARNMNIVSEVLKTKSASPPQGKSTTHRRSSGAGRQKHRASTSPSRSKTPNRGSKRGTTPKRNRKDKSEGKHKGEDLEMTKSASPTGNPAAHVTSLLINHVVSPPPSPEETTSASASTDDDFGYSRSFLWTSNTLEILADLVLAVPACAAAIHKFRPSRGKIRSGRSASVGHINHALLGCPNPPKTFVSFLLHSLLPQDRWSSRKDHALWERRAHEESDEAEEIRSKKKAAFRRTKIAQTSARLLVALVARPGEGRRRVVAELAFALSGGRLGHLTSAHSSSIKERTKTSELHALQAWGELCIGLAAPRSNGSNYDGNASLSFEVVKIMLEVGMAHALLVAIHRVPLHHPMASGSCGALILPFEIMTRASVADALKAIADKESSSKESKEATKSAKNDSPSELSRGHSSEIAHRNDSFEEDHMLEEAFGMDAAGLAGSHNMDHALNDGFVEDGDGDVHHDFIVAEDDHDFIVAEDDHDFIVAEDDHDDEEEVDGDDHDVEMDDVDDEDEEGSEEDDDDEMSSSEESEDSSDGDDSEEEDDEDDDDEDNSVLDGSEENGSGDEIEQDGDFNVDYREDILVENQDFEGDESGTDRVDSALDEGWTRIESTGFGGMLLGARRGGTGVPAGNGNLTARTRGFIDAAEAMIGTLLRTGEIHGDALAEIEGSLGIRIMPNNRGLPTLDGIREPGETLASRLGGAASNGPADQARRADVVGTLPHIHQRSQPDVGYSALGGGGRWNEISSMEYIYGGPSVTAGSRNYDVISPVANPDDDDSHPTISQVDGQLFPGGPAAAAHARTQHSLHPLLCGVDLPPVNSLVSDLLPHGVRATRRGQMTTRRPGDWTNASTGGFLVSTSNGNIIRSSRSPNGGPLSMMAPTRNVFGPVGWTDDGLPFDATVEDFSTAFERALGASMTIPVASSARDEGATINTNGDQAEDSPTANETNAPEQVNAATVNQADANMADGAPSRAEENMEESNDASPGSLGEAGEETNYGDGVASSLAEGLRLSPRTDESSTPGDQPVVESDPQLAEADASGDGDQAQEEEIAQVEPSAMDEQEETVSSNQHQEDATQGGPEAAEESNTGTSGENEPNGNGLVCPPGMDLEVFNCLPVDMQNEVIEQARAAGELAAQLDAGSSLDPEALAALPEDMRREVIEQERQERRMREAPADPNNAEEMDNASFVASLAPDLRNEILMTADDAFLQSLPPNIIAEAQILRERASADRRVYEEAPVASSNAGNANAGNAASGDAQRNGQGSGREQGDSGGGASARRKQRSGKIRVESDREAIVPLPPGGPVPLTPPVAKSDVKALLRLMYLLSPVRPHRLLQKVFQNLCLNPNLRHVLSSTFVKLLHDDNKGALFTLDELEKEYGVENDWRKAMDDEFSRSLNDFPPAFLIGAAPEVLDTEGLNPNITLLRRKQTNDTAASIAANLPMSAGGSRHEQYLPPVVATRIVDTLLHMCKNSPRFCLATLVNEIASDVTTDGNQSTCFEKMIDLLEKPRYSKSSANLEQLLILLESAVSPLSNLSKHGDDDMEVTQKDVDSAAATGKVWVDVPRIVVSQQRLQLLCSILRMETCRDVTFTKVNTIARRLCRVEANRGYVLAELASVAHALGVDATRDLKALNIRMANAVTQNQHRLVKDETADKDATESSRKRSLMISGGASSSVAVSTSTSELKLLRVLQTLQALCADTSEESGGKKNEGSVIVTEELVHLLRAMNLDDLWKELTACLKVVQVLEGVTSLDEEEEKKMDDADNNDGDDDNTSGGKKLQNSVAGLLTRFLPSIEAFFVANASATRAKDDEKEESMSAEKTEDGTPGRRNSTKPGSEESNLDNLVGGNRLVDFVTANKVLLNALVRSNAGLLDKGLRALVQVPRCRHLLDFDVKRHWFKTQVRRLRQHASRRHGSLRLHIRRKHVFEDAYHQLRLRNADEMRGRLHITFRNEEGVDAGGLSREFFGILAKEIFNPNYALFTSTEDGSTFQPNPNSSINPDHLSYFRFVGRIVGKAVADGYLLDAHFTRSLYKHMLGIKVGLMIMYAIYFDLSILNILTLCFLFKPTHHDMEAIDPDYYKNLKTILEYNLDDLGLDLTFSIEDHSFGRSQTLDLIPNGRNVPVTEENKAKYVSMVCQYRMTTAISSQIKAYQDGFYELVSRDLIAIFTPRELELLISGLPDIDVLDLKQNTDYMGWKATDKEIEWFWNVLFSLSRNEKAAFLQFVTGSSKVPLAGFGELPGMRGVQKFSLHKASGSSGALMSAHTCFNSLDLPVYTSEEELREKLLYAINEGVGAFLFA